MSAGGDLRIARRKAVVIGDGACGKTCLLHVFRLGRFPLSGHYIPTVFDTWVVDIEVDTTPVELALWDTAGQEDFDRLRFLCYPDANIIIICFSVDSHDSLNNVYEKWHPEAEANSPNSPIVLVALKSDLRDDPNTIREMMARYHEEPIKPEQGEEMARRINAVSYIECSSLRNENVTKVFEVAARHALRAGSRRPNGQSPSGLCCVIL
ncbi:Ras-like GTP-binding protein rho1 [Coemansia sp. RSA 2050]|nr:Ras-like GTP-binding protein rho1 [Coemansia sp. RSA 2050]KAJ2734806.1 Ras-like GTP-binding protein rho1 [Coemansia sp. BCRC 34962]